MDQVPLLNLLSVGVTLTFIVRLAACVTQEEDITYTWLQTKVPVIQDRHTMHLSRPAFRAEAESEFRVVCGIECQSLLSHPTVAELEKLLSYETVYENGTRTLTAVSLQSPGPAWDQPVLNGSTRSRSRYRRELYGLDSRFTIDDLQYSTKYPFATTVKVSSGCSGILLSPKHVLTAAHCIHDGRDYVKGAKKLRVGFLKLRSRRLAGGKGAHERGGRRRGERKGQRREGAQRAKQRSRRGVPTQQPSFQWTRVKRTQIPTGWFKDVSQKVALDYDYALLELKRPQKQRFMDLGIVPSVKKLPAGRIHFSGFDNDRPGQLVYRFCSVSDESSDLLYQYCDAQPGSSGSGVYIRLKEPGKKKWKRKIIAVYSGHKWVDVNGVQQEYNVAVRITPEKYAQICYWIHGDSNMCRST